MAGIVVFLTFCVFQLTFHLGYIEDGGVETILKVLQYYIYLYVVITTYNRICKAVLLTFEYFFYLSMLMIIVDCIMVCLAYYLCLKRNRGSQGIFEALIFVITARTVSHLFKLFVLVDWKDKIEGPNGLANRVKQEESTQDLDSSINSMDMY